MAARSSRGEKERGDCLSSAGLSLAEEERATLPGGHIATLPHCNTAWGPQLSARLGSNIAVEYLYDGNEMFLAMSRRKVINKEKNSNQLLLCRQRKLISRVKASDVLMGMTIQT